MTRGIFEIRLSNKADKQFAQLDAKMRGRVKELLNTLQEMPIPKDSYDLKKLKGRRDEYRIRLSSFRVQYRIFWTQGIIRVAEISRRSDSTYD